MTSKPQKLDKIVGDVCKDKNDLLARKEMNAEFRQRLLHFLKHRNTAVINNVFSKITPPTLKFQILRHVVKKLPFKPNSTKDGVIMDKARFDGLTPQLINVFNLMDGVIQKETLKGVIKIDCDQEAVSVDEFVSWLADTLTLRRRELSDDQIDYLIELLNMIKVRRSNKSTGQERS